MISYINKSIGYFGELFSVMRKYGVDYLFCVIDEEEREM